MARLRAGRLELRRKPWIAALVLMLDAAAAAAASAQIATDGTMGPAQVLGGPDVTIPAGLGTASDGNLFHSFSDFNIATGGSATFTGPGDFANVISRVTGGSMSNIDGALISQIGTSGFFFINPAGVLFGPNASIDVPGAFHVSTADQVRFPDGGVFDASTPGNTILSVADPSSFGFLNANPASISVTGATLGVAAGQTLSLVGGNVTIDGGTLSAPSGVISLASVDSPGDASLPASAPALTGFSALGAAELRNAALVSTRGDPGGTIYVRSGQLTVDNSALAESETAMDSATTGTADGAPVGVDIQVTGDVVLDKAEIASSSFGAGRSGDVSVVAGRVQLIADDSDGDPNELGANIASRVFAAGPGGDILISADSVELAANSIISTEATEPATGQSGNISINARSLLIDGSMRSTFVGAFSSGAGAPGGIEIVADSATLLGGAPAFVGITSQINSASTSTADAGPINLTIGRLEALDGGQINASVFSGTGSGGDVNIVADSILIQGIDAGGFPAGIFSSSAVIPSSVMIPAGDSGSISIEVGDLTLLDRGQISTYAESFGNGGAIDIQAETVSIASGAFLGATSFGFGLAGPITVQANSIELAGPSPDPLTPFDFPFTGVASLAGAIAAGGGTIALSADQVAILDGAQINARTNGLGDGGRVEVSTESLLISGFDETNARAAGIVTDTFIFPGLEGFAFGDAGGIDITATSLLVSNDGVISSLSSSFGNAGSVDIAANSATFSGGALVSSASTLAGSAAAAGTVTIDAKLMQVLADAEVSTSTAGAGPAGTITLTGDRLNIDNSTITSSTASTGSGGNVVVVANGLVQLAGADAGILTESASAAPGAGTAGNITIAAGELQLTGGAQISTQAASADGGDIDLALVQTLLLRDSRIATSVGTGQGAGGNIRVATPVFVILQDSAIQANAFGGPGGNILIVANNFIATPDSIVEASSQLGLSGTVRIESPDTDVSTGVVVLSESLMDAAARLAQQCGARGGRTLASFVGVGRGGLPAQPGVPMPSHYLAAGTKSLAGGEPKAAPRLVGLPSGTVFVPATLQLACSA